MRSTWLAALLVIVASTAAIIGGVPQAGGARKTFELTAKRFAFTPDRVEVSQGDTVVITARSADSTHGIEIKKFKVKKTVPKGGAPITVEFVASEAGTFEIGCAEYCGKGHKQMKGTLVVMPRVTQ